MIDWDISAHQKLLHAYGLFMVIWSIFESVIDLSIEREAGLQPLTASILLSGVGFERKVSIARTFLSIKERPNTEAISLINKIIQDASRNTLVHGRVHVGKSELSFVKRDTSQTLKVKEIAFSADQVTVFIVSLNELLKKFMLAVKITDQDLEEHGDKLRNLESKFRTSPRPPSSTTTS